MLKILRTIIRIENVMFVYRNYSVISLRRKYLVKTYIFLVICAQLLLSCIGVLNKIFTKSLQRTLTYNFFIFNYSVFSVINNIAAIILSYYHSELFQIFVTNIDDSNIICGNDVMYQKSIKKLNKLFIKTVLLYFGIVLSLLFVYCINSFEYFHDLHILIPIISDLTLQFRYFWENLTFHLLIEVLVANMGYLNNSISTVSNNLHKKCVERLGRIEEVRNISAELKKWGIVSRLLVNAIDCLGCIFGLQITLSLLSSLLYHVVMLYQAIIFALNKGLINIARVGAAGFVTILSAYFLTKLSVLWSGQRARNQAQRLDAALARLRVRLMLIPGSEATACARAAARLARSLRAAPLRLRLLSSLTIQMALLTEILGVIANYTIVLLQFNHVV